jgi:fructuronate reductase
MRGDAAARQLLPQDLLYSVRSRGVAEDRLQIVGALTGIVVAPGEPGAVDAAFADPAIRVVTLTVTEKGYCLGDDGWSLDRSLPAVRADLDRPLSARTAIGLLARGLDRRRECGGAPLTIISCDNLAENGRRLRGALRDYLEAVFPRTLDWMEAAVRFPCSMVDRIVPAMTDQGRERQAARLGLWDAAPLATEPFCQWFLEDEVAGDLPDWQGAGVQLVRDVRPFEAIKLRLLNAAHSAIAYCGLLAGEETVAQVMARPPLRRFIGRLMTVELEPALSAPPGFDLAGYRDALLERFANPHLEHRCAQIAMDGTEKIRQRWLPTLRRLPEDSLLQRALAAWCWYVLETDLELQDPRRERLLSLRASERPLAARLENLLDCLGLDPAADPLAGRRLAQLQGHCEHIARRGILGLVADPGTTTDA